MVTHINPYLVDAPNAYILKRKKMLSPVLSPVERGSIATDDGNLLINNNEELEEVKNDAIAAKYIRPYRMGRELINGIDRWCLWMVDASPKELRSSSILLSRVSKCRDFREHSSKAGTRKKAEKAWLFDEIRQPDSTYLAIPCVFSAQRQYMTCDWYSPDIIAGAKVFFTEDPTGFNFAIMESSLFMVWQKTIGGGVKSDCQFSNTVVWNNLPLPEVSMELRSQIIKAGQMILAERGKHPNDSLADLYDPMLMPTGLRAAHRELDKLVDRAFGALKPLKSDEGRLALLFSNYARMTQAERQHGRSI